MTDEEMGFKDPKTMTDKELAVEAHDHAITLQSIYPYSCGTVSRRRKALIAEMNEREKSKATPGV